MAVVYAPNITAEGVSFFRHLVPFFDYQKRIVLVVGWNATFDRQGRKESERVKKV